MSVQVNHLPLQLNDLLKGNDINPEKVLVLRHRPWERQLNKVFSWLAAERPELYNAYQQTQAEKVERAMTRAAYVASFIGHQPGKALFVGLYSVNGSKRINRKQFWQIPASKELKAFGMNGFTEDSQRMSCLWFDLALTEFYSSWKGRLIVEWPGKELSWWRWADRNILPVLAILQESILAAAMPRWDDISLTWNELRILPRSWRDALMHWRGVYYIFDLSDAKGYIGSAYGDENLLRRWENYAKRGHGGNKLLRQRDPVNFLFTILERVSPDMAASDVIQLESSWKNRLHTRQPHGLNEN